MFYNDILFFIPAFWTLPLPFIGNVKVWFLLNIIIFIAFFVLILAILKNQKYFKNWFLKKNTCYLIGWKMGDWKTRLMTKFSQEIIESENKKHNTFIIANYLNKNSNLFFQSFNDFYFLQKDIQAIALYLNFDWNEKKEIEKIFPWYFNYDDYLVKYKKEFEKIKTLTKWKIQFITLLDEAHLYFYARMAMSNFSKVEWKKMLEMLHQTRHSNQLLILSSQDTDAIDLDLRQISDKEIEVKEYMNWLFYGFNLYHYLNLKYQNKEDKLFFQKINTFPFVFFNFYLLYKLFIQLNQINIKIWSFLFKIYNKIFKKNKIYDYNFKNPFLAYVLPYNTNFNVNIWLNIYKEGDIFKKIIKKFDL